MANQSLPSLFSSGGTLNGSRSSKKLLFSLIGASSPELSVAEPEGGPGSLATTDVGAVPGPETLPAPVKGVVVEGGGGKPGPPVRMLFGG
jgi:hypothetical protein